MILRIVIAGLAIIATSPAFAADAARGKELFTACVACHTERPDSLGPSLKGVVGRKAAALEDFRYSPAMRRSNVTWDQKSLHDYLMNPQDKIKGNRMPFSGYPNGTDADDVIAYLVTYK
jgi:cytochrome c